jgi:hypothetical protein
LLRPLLEKYYEVQTEVPVGDAPRQADVLLLRRTSSAAPPFCGLWRGLTAWNVLEFKGPTVSARVDDLDDLLEVGLGIQPHLNEERAKKRQALVGRGEVSFWYLANHLGRRFLRSVRELAGELEETAAGVWRGCVWQRTLVLVSTQTVSVELDSLPVHLLSTEPETTQREVVRVLGEPPDLWRAYAAWLATVHPTLLQELLHMGKEKTRKPTLDVRPLVQHLGWQEILQQTGLQDLVAQLDPAQRQELLRLLQETPPEKPGRGKK